MINVHACSGLCSSLPEHFFRHSPDPGSSEQRNMSYVQLIRGYSPAATRRKRGWMGSISNQHSAGILADRVPLQKSSGLDHQWNYQGIRPLNSGLLKKKKHFYYIDSTTINMFCSWSFALSRELRPSQRIFSNPDTINKAESSANLDNVLRPKQCICKIWSSK